MKKLFALAIVAGMVFVGCNQKPAEEPEAVAEEQTEEVVAPQDEQTAEMPAEEAAQEEAAK
jgi:PBP1b-binding outer membrane lipoprotein LpoB